MAFLDYFLPSLYAFLACIGFCVIFNVRGFGILICSLGGGLSWLVYLLSGLLVGQSEILQSFWAAVFLSLYAELMARHRKCPVTGYLLIGFLPLVPGGGIYYSMEYTLNGETELGLATGLHTLGIAAALAVGVLLVSSLVRMHSTWKGKTQQKERT